MKIAGLLPLKVFIHLKKVSHHGYKLRNGIFGFSLQLCHIKY